MNIGSRIAAWFGGKKLPYDAEVEWLSSDGNQYIDTGIKASSKIGWRCKIPDLKNNITVFCGTFLTQRYYQFVGSELFYATQSGFSSVFVAIETNVDVVYDVDPIIGISKLEANGKILSNPFSIYDFEESVNFPIIGFNFSGRITKAQGNTYAYVGKFGFAKITENGTLVRDFIPVRKDGVGYMYDRVSGQLFGNAGTGAFVIGPDKSANGGGYKCLVRFVKSLVASLSSLSRYLRKEVAR